MNEAGRPERIAGDPRQILQLIAFNEAIAAEMSDAELDKARGYEREHCARLWPKIEQAQRDYQVPSQAFYVFDRILNRRQLNAEIARAID